MDPPASFGQKGKENLTIQNLPILVEDVHAKSKIAVAVLKARTKSQFCLDWRKRYLAHRDLKLAIDENARPLEAGSKKQVDEALDAITETLNIVDAHYTGGASYFKLPVGPGGAVSVLYAMDEALRAKEKRGERLLPGEISEEDFASPL
jgi:hypothetical protein